MDKDQLIDNAKLLAQKTKQLIDLRMTLSGKMSRSMFWMQCLLLIGLTLLALFIWCLLSMGKCTDMIFTAAFSANGADHFSPGDLFGGWQTWLLGIYGVWLMVISFCMQVRRLRDVGKNALLPVLMWVLFVGSILMGSAIGGLMCGVASIIGLIVLFHTLRGSKVVEGEEPAPAPPALAWGVVLVPWALGVLLYVSCASSWVELAKGGAAMEEQDDAAALAHFNRAAEKGNKVAQIMLVAYSVQQSKPEALPAVRQMAESRNALAQFLLAAMYDNGYPGLEPNKDEALAWLKKAAEQGFKPAIEQLQALEKQ